jgi:type III secretory pathway component EscS
LLGIFGRTYIFGRNFNIEKILMAIKKLKDKSFSFEIFIVGLVYTIPITISMPSSAFLRYIKEYYLSK